MRKSTDSFGRFLGGMEGAAVALFKGRTVDALRILDEAASGEGSSGSNQTAILRNFAAAVLLLLLRLVARSASRPSF